MRKINRIINKIAKTVYSFSMFKIERELKNFYLKNNNEDYTEISRKLKNKILKYVTQNVPYYKSFKSNKLPITSKKIFQDNDEDIFFSDRSTFIAKYKMNTGGSTGEPFHFHVDVRAGFIDNLHQKYQHQKAGFESKNDKIFVINGFMPNLLDIKKSIFWRRKKSKNQLPFGSKEFSAHFLTQEYFNCYITELKKNPPDFIRSYPSSMCDLTLLLIENGFEKKPFILKGIQLTSEATSKQQEDIIKNYWGNIIYYQYGHSEAGTIASKYPDEDCYSFSPLYGSVEILNSNDQHVLPGEEGRIVVTSYHNFARPFIRYDTGDLAIYKDSNNGIVKVYNITGRSQDYVTDKNGKKLSVTALIFGQHFKAFGNILSWQIVNKENGILNINIVKGRNYCENDEAEIKEKLYFDGKFQVNITYVNEIKKTINGKHKLVIN
ncbi:MULTISPECIES: phenylacetate--CoA ligase family protein [Providencia]|uniref:phenylacetate--CoA ligase family protein n=1 Tax=Providencia TaxID=586 RepID=UPI00197FA00C|nr:MULTISPECIES: phenylacetate--CoA ligase family protein [Providencia]MBN4866509.1 phenylacetate--CoA ligase family protein [Providencia stuartii]MBN4875831.1 phenylacetate--CoA ligase family protein [Providencia stuartii]MBN4880523.1 phenylacetate--CoA ligase family protein [Providencia stuartii]MBN4885031.1 phenylacetate--CoA ligase family protein [Providencia stuartii]